LNSAAASSSDHDKLRRVFAHAAAGLAVTDFKGNCLEMNPAYAKVLSLEPEAIANANILEFIHPEDRSRHQVLLDQLLAGQIPDFTIEKRYLRPDGSSVWVRSSVTAFDEDNKLPRHLVHICEDISDRKRLEKTAAAQDKLAVLGRLASSIVHEISNPLESVRNFIYLARSRVSAEDVKYYLQSAEEEIERVAHIATHTLQFHRQAADPAPADVAEVLDSVLSLFRSRIKRAHVTVRIEKREGAILTCLAVEIRQVVANLIANALDALREGGILRLRVGPATVWRSQQPGVRITVADTGSGMTAEARRHIYESFFTTKGAEGTGLGLWVSANIVNRYGGSIHVRSKQGSGTAFTVVFPEGAVAGKAATQERETA
jgi:PAS domain S-box-containing protein